MIYKGLLGCFIMMLISDITPPGPVTGLSLSKAKQIVTRQMDLSNAYRQPDLKIMNQFQKNNDVYTANGFYKDSPVQVNCGRDTGLNNKNQIINIYNSFRTRPLPSDHPISSGKVYVNSYIYEFPLKKGHCYVSLRKCDTTLFDYINNQLIKEQDHIVQLVTIIKNQIIKGMRYLQAMDWDYSFSIGQICINSEYNVLFSTFNRVYAIYDFQRKKSPYNTYINNNIINMFTFLYKSQYPTMPPAKLNAIVKESVKDILMPE
ncbi:hypothetical protein BDF19DRAFT_465094 [Syncephalis fuscata]|nr:hypothetical protein BDF19DRAFT_465094 [Syncephalis fuscata]